MNEQAREAVANMQAQVIQLRFARVLQRQAEMNGFDTEEKAEAWMIEQMQEIEKKIPQDFPETLPDQLNRFRQDVGDETWESLKDNPNLQQMAEEHTRKIAIEFIKKRADAVMEICSEANSEEDKPLTADEFLFALSRT